MPETDMQKLEQAALRLLGMREHSRQELRRKLASRTSRPEQLEMLLDSLTESGAQSDQRFAREYVNFRSHRGFGPVRIRMELNERGIDTALADVYLDAGNACWDRLLLETVKGKFGDEPAAGFNEWAKRARFLEYRGFSQEHIRRLLRT